MITKDSDRIKNESSNGGGITVTKIAKYIGVIIGTFILICLLAVIFFSDTIINTFFKDRIAKALAKTYPEYAIQLGDIHYNIWKNRVRCDSLLLQAADSSFTCNINSFALSGIGWMKILMQRDFTTSALVSAVVDAQKIVLKFNKSQSVLRFGKMHISIPDSEATVDTIRYYSSIEDEQYFAKSKFRQTRYQFDIPRLKITGLDYVELLRGGAYKSRSIEADNIFADILVNMDKPYDKQSENPQMPNEILSSIEQIIKIDSVRINNGQLKYSERFTVRGKPGVITFDHINASVAGIANHNTVSDTAVIKAEGIFMSSGKMKLLMLMPLSSSDFSLKYSGSLTKMDVTRLNAFIEPGEHHRIKTGILQSANFNITVKSGRANGSLWVVYKDLTIAILDKETGSEKGIFNRILSFFGKVFVIRGSNQPDEKGLMKIGGISYVRNPQDYFFQVLWFALRGGVADVVGFPKE